MWRRPQLSFLPKQNCLRFFLERFWVRIALLALSRISGAMLSRVLGFFAKRGKQLAGTDTAGNSYYRQLQNRDGAGPHLPCSLLLSLPLPAPSLYLLCLLQFQSADGWSSEVRQWSIPSLVSTFSFPRLISHIS
jgi:hypothetical protein